MVANVRNKHSSRNKSFNKIIDGYQLIHIVNQNNRGSLKKGRKLKNIYA